MRKLFLACLLVFAGFVASAQTLKGNVTQFMSAGRIVDGEQIQETDLPYVKQGVPFTIMIVPKSSDNYTEVEKIRARYYQGDNLIDIPILVNTWNSVAINYLADVLQNSNIFTYYDVYIGFGQDIQGL